jgi:hypothetical protein
MLEMWEAFFAFQIQRKLFGARSSAYHHVTRIARWQFRAFCRGIFELYPWRSLVTHIEEAIVSV